ncbi:alpha/beta fold hydrolase [Sandaracinobacter sp. RS1-74]|uniref:alpha/beta hydrolase n=1 Tax=Sandaracinobacteroides sayramensis TaxID=2913411 RepID=UPI001EDB0561|nr:alpha/beta hydrolase [Sandaracinobacteroides sayramensis]MCG2840382.1 alpha/beta fold hydrolase [Sandaracinobacteroides sayramensis]
MIRIPAAALLLSLPAAPLFAQAKLPELPRLMQPRAVMSIPAAAPTESIRYGEAPSQQVELFLPRAAQADGRHPVVVMVHGGCWRKDVAGPELLRPAAAAFLEKGFAVWSIGYRRVDEEGGGYPGTYQDVAQAIDLLREHAEARQLDLTRTVLFGHSAGGHLALWAAGRSKLPAASPLRVDNPLKPRGVVSVGGFGSLKKWQGEIGINCGPDIVQKLAPGDGDARFADTSPEQLLPSGVRTILLHGVFDGVASPATGLDHAQDARRAGDLAEIQIAPVAGHFDVIAPGTAAFAQALAAVERLSNSR